MNVGSLLADAAAVVFVANSLDKESKPFRNRHIISCVEHRHLALCFPVFHLEIKVAQDSVFILNNRARLNIGEQESLGPHSWARSRTGVDHLLPEPAFFHVAINEIIGRCLDVVHQFPVSLLAIVVFINDVEAGMPGSTFRVQNLDTTLYIILNLDHILGDDIVHIGGLAKHHGTRIRVVVTTCHVKLLLSGISPLKTRTSR